MTRFVACAIALFVSSAAFAALEVGEAQNNVVAYTVASETPSITLTVMNTKDEDVSARVRLSPFVDSGGTPYATKPLPAELKVGRFGTEELTINCTGKLAKADTYTAILRLAAKDAVTTVAIKLTRPAAAAAGITVDDVPGIFVAMPVGFSAGTSEPFAVRIRESGGAAVTVQPPVVTSFSLKPNEKVSMSAAFPTFTGPAAALTAKGSTTMHLALQGIKSAGRYEGKADFAADGLAPVSKTFTVYARQPCTVAASFIALGVLVSFLLRWYAKVGRPRLLVMNRVANLADELRKAAAAADDDAEAVRFTGSLRAALVRRYEYLAHVGRLVGATDFDLFESKLPLLMTWIEVRRDLLALSLPVGARKTLEDGLREAAATIANSAATAVDVAQQASKLGALRSKTEAEAAAEIGKMLDDLDAELAGSADPGAAALRNRALAIRQRIQEKDYAGALADVTDLRLDYIALLTRALRKKLPDVPLGMTQNDWAPIEAEATAFLDAADAAADPDVAFAAYKKALEAWLRPAAVALQTKANTEAAKAGPLSPYAVIAAELGTIAGDVAAGKVMAAAERFAALRLRYDAAGAPPAKLAHAAALAAPAGPVTALLDIPSANRRIGIDTAFGRAIAHWGLIIGTVLSTLLIMVLAILLGVKILWADDWTWGGPMSALIAFLWGAGLHAVTYDGLSGLVSKLIPSTQP
jgi:hypothetical protein